MENTEFINRLWLQGAPNDIKKLKESIKGTDEIDKTQKIHIDFNKIIKMPKELDIQNNEQVFLAVVNQIDPESSTVKSAPHPFDLNKEEFKLYIKYLENLYHHGHSNFLHWRIDNWNSAWNAYNTSEKPGYIQFSTGISPPINVILKLSFKFKDIMLELGFADKDTGTPGRLSFYNGIVKQISFDSHEEKSAFSHTILGGL